MADAIATACRAARRQGTRFRQRLTSPADGALLNVADRTTRGWGLLAKATFDKVVCSTHSAGQRRLSTRESASCAGDVTGGAPCRLRTRVPEFMRVPAIAADS
jgi:hypothetical protein